MTWTPGDVSGSQTLTDSDHLYPGHINELRVAFAGLSISSIKDYGAVGDGATDDTLAFTTALSTSNRVIFIPAGTYIVDGIDPIIGTNITLYGEGAGHSIIKLKDSRSSSNAVFTLNGCTNITLSDFEINGNWANNASSNNAFNVYDAEDITIERLKITYVNGTAWQGGSNTLTKSSKRLRMRDCHFEEVLGGLVFAWYEDLLVDNCKVITCGGSGIMMAAGGTAGSVDYDNCHNKHIKITKNYVNKATKPANMSTTETGWLVGLSGADEDVICSHNDLYDNRNAAYDGIGTFPYGDPHQGVVISNNVVRYAGAYGIDACSNCVISNNTIIEPLLIGVAVLTDGLSNLENIIVDGNVITNAGDSTHIGQGIVLGFGSGSKTTENVLITNNIVRDNRLTKYCDEGITLNGTSGTVQNVNIYNNDLADVSDVSIYPISTGVANIRTANNIMLYPILPVSGASFSAIGQNDFSLGQTGATNMTAITGGFDGQVIRIIFADAHSTFSNGAAFRLTSATFTGATLGSLILQYKLANTIWVELSRTVPV